MSTLVALILLVSFSKLVETRNGVTACDLDLETAQLVSAFQETLRCLDARSCSPNLTDSPKAGQVIILLNEMDWFVGREAAAKLAKCQVPTALFIIGSKSDGEASVARIQCRIDRPKDSSVILDFTEEDTFGIFKEYEQSKTGSNGSRCSKMQLRDHDLPRRLLEKCSNVVWISADWGSCHAGTWRAVRMYRGDTAGRSILYDWMYGRDQFEMLRNRTLVVGIVPGFGPFVRTRLQRSDGVPQYEGVGLDVLRHLSEVRKFKYRFVESIDGSFGNEIVDSTFGRLRRKEIDLYLGPLTPAVAVDFTTTIPFRFDSMAIMISKPKVVRRGIWQFLTPFSKGIWMTIVTSLVLGSVFFYSLYVFDTFWIVTRFRRLKACFWYLFAGLLGQGAEIEPVSLFGQTFLSYWWILCLIVTACYKGSLVSILSTTDLRLPFENLRGFVAMLERNKVKVCTENMAMKTTLTTDPHYPEQASIRSWLEQNPTYVKTNGTDCVELMLRDDTVAYISERSVLERYRAEYCQTSSFIILEERFYSNDYGLVLQEDSAFGPLISEVIQTAAKAGLIDRWTEKYTRSNTFCATVEPNRRIIAAHPHPLSLEELGGIFVVLSIGSILGCVLFCCERIQDAMDSHMNNVPISFGRPKPR